MTAKSQCTSLYGLALPDPMLTTSRNYNSLSFWIRTILMLITLPVVGCSSQVSNPNEVLITCDAEHVQQTSAGLKFVSGQYHFDHGQNRTEELARSGKASVKLMSGSEFGMTYLIHDAVEGERITAQVWRHSSSAGGELVVAADPIQLLHLRTQDAIKLEKDGWELLELRFNVPFGVDSILIYAFGGANKPAFFDDILIKRVPPENIPRPDEIPHLYVLIDSVDLQRIADLRADAMTQGMLSDWHKMEFACSIRNGDELLSGKVRLKGDWTDHLNTAKWSFRIKLDEGKTIDGKRTFSIQHPETRSFMEEWLMHLWFRHEGVLTTAYDFVNVSVNGVHKGIYAREEHFEKQLPESQNKREGVIIKLDETMFWKKQATIDDVYWGGMNLPDIQMAATLPFKQKKTLKNEALGNQFLTAQNLLEKLKSFDTDMANYMDVDLLARHYAIQMLFNSEHGLAWHNRRWYFNPVTAKLEPIAYDCSFPHADTETPFHFLNDQEYDQEDLFKYYVFNDPEFANALLGHLNRICHKAHIDSVNEVMAEDVQQVREMLQVEFPRYDFDLEKIKTRAAEIRAELHVLESWITSGKTLRSEPLDFGHPTPLLVSTCVTPRVFSHQQKNETQYHIENMGFHDLHIIGFTRSKHDSKSFKKPIIVRPGKSFQGEVLLMKHPIKTFLYRYAGSDSTMSVHPFDWPKPVSGSPRQVITKFPKDHASIESVDGKTIKLKTGKHRIKELYLFAEGDELVIAAGTEILLEKGAGLIIQGPINFMGEAEQPIKVSAASADNHGITVLQTGSKSELSNVSFVGLNTLHRADWTLTGAVNFYEANVDISNCSFASNVCEDALNIIRSDFHVNECLFEKTFGDAFDSDFCTGTLSNSRFKSTANDAIDFSGSVVNISDCGFEQIGDKAVSGGEHSTLTATGLSINGAEIGIASKDLSDVSVSNTQISNCKFGYVAYTKKPEYGGALLQIKNVKTNSLEIEYDIEVGSSMLLNENMIKGTQVSRVPKY